MAEYSEIKTHFDFILLKNDYEKLTEIGDKAQNLIKMVRDHPMHTKLRDMVYDVYCKNQKGQGPKLAGSPNLVFLYESMVEPVSIGKVVKKDEEIELKSERENIHKAYQALSNQCEELEVAIEDNRAKQQKVMTTEELKQALVSYGIDSNFNCHDLTLDLRIENVRNLLECYKEYRFPKLQKLTVHTNLSFIDATNNFLGNNFPLEVHNFFFGCYGPSYRCDIKVYIDKLLSSISHVKDCFRIQHCLLPKDYFEKILNSIKHVNTLVIDHCVTDSDVYDFKGCEYSIKNLYLRTVGHSNLANWKDKPKKFEAIVKGLSQTSLKKNLEHLSIYGCQYEIADAKKQIELYGMGHINLTGNNHVF